MAGDWIKMRRGLRHDPKVIAIARELSDRRDFMNWWSDPVRKSCKETVTEIVTFANVTRVTVCALLDVWAALNNSILADGKAPFMALTDLDDIAEIPGFGEAMESVGWVIDNGEQGLVFPNFTEHNSPSKSRTSSAKSDAERAREYRLRKRSEEAQKNSVTASRDVTTEKRREDISTLSVPREDEVTEFASKQPGWSTEVVKQWFLDRSSQGWVKGSGVPITNWRADLEAWVLRQAQGNSPSGNQRGGRNQPQKPARTSKFAFEIPNHDDDEN
jgi:hypothetical protein